MGPEYLEHFMAWDQSVKALPCPLSQVPLCALLEKSLRSSLSDSGMPTAFTASL